MYPKGCGGSSPLDRTSRWGPKVAFEDRFVVASLHVGRDSKAQLVAIPRLAVTGPARELVGSPESCRRVARLHFRMRGRRP